MPSIENLINLTEKRIDLSEFFGEETFITIKRMPKYNFSHLLNEYRGSFSQKLHILIAEWRKENPDLEYNTDVYIKLKDSLSKEDSEKAIELESFVDREYYKQSILSDKHNITDKNGELIPINGEWFYETFSGFRDKDSRYLNDKIINEIVKFNHSGITLGE